MILLIEKNGQPRASRPTTALVPVIVAALKKKTNNACGLDIWQTSYNDRIIRNEAEHLKIYQYIDNNPSRWAEDRYYNK